VLGGKTSRAIARLELAAREPETAVSALTDLSALHLLHFETDGDPLDLLRAVQAADRGLALDPAQAPLLFNRAQALSRLGTRRLAEKAWEEILGDETASGWRDEALSHLQELRQPSDEERWERALPALESSAASPEQIIALVESLPANARAHAEEILLPRWATAVSRGDVRAESSLRLATTIGDVLSRTRGEALLSDTVGVILKTMEYGTPSQRDALLRGLRAFGVGVAQYHEQNLTSAQEPLLQAARDLEGIGCPLSYWARFYLAIGEYYSDADRGLTILNSLLEEVPQDRYPALTGRIEWIAGTIDKVQGRIQSSIRRYDHSASSLRRAGGDRSAAFVAVLLAEVYSLYGEHALGWQQRLFAFHRVRYSEGARRNIAMWIEAKEALLRQGHLDLAGPLVEEAVAEADRWGRPLGQATAYLERASYRLAVDDRPAALTDLREAQQALSQMEDSALKEQITFSALITEGLYERATDPARAAVLLDRALEGQTSTSNRFEAITYTTAKAAAELAAGQVDAGAKSLEEAISIFETIRSTVEDPVSRMQAFRQAQPAFDELMRLRTAVVPNRDPEETFRLAERARARVLLDLRTGKTLPAKSEDDFVRLADLEKIVPSGTALVSYAVLEDRVLAWVIDEGHARLVTLEIHREEIAKMTKEFRLEMAREADEEELQKAAAPLYDALIQPLGLAPRDGSLVIVPDRWLSRLPFAALYDRRAGQYLIQQRTVTIAPSATLLVRGSEKRPHSGPRDLSVLAVGVSRAGTFSGRSLRRLPNAGKEAQEVAAIYEESTTLIDLEARKENFLRLSVSNDVVHFAGHAMVDLEAPRRSVLLFAGPSETTLEPFSLGELFDAGLGQASLVVLSACRAQDSLVDDREGILGIAGAFFAAGVPEIVASPWNVEDRTSLPVMVAFHREYRKHRSAGVAFRQAVLGLLRSGSPEERSPASWGGFTIIEGSLRREDQ
jgi:CHAT domain-containing protein